MNLAYNDNSGISLNVQRKYKGNNIFVIFYVPQFKERKKKGRQKKQKKEDWKEKVKKNNERAET